MGCFSGDVKGQSVKQVDKLTPEQQRLVSLLSSRAAPAIEAVGGATIPGMEFAPAGPSPLQQQAFGMAGQDIGQMMAPVSEFAQNIFQQETIPSVMGALGAQGMARSSGAAEILGRQGRNLGLGMAAQFAPMQFQQPGQMAGLGGIQRGIGEEQTQFGLNRFMMGAPEADPRLGFIGPAFTSAYDTAVQQGFFSPGLGSQILSAGGQAAGAKMAMACVVEGTIIDCRDGKKPVEDVRTGDIVFDKNNSLSVVMWKYEFKDYSTNDRFIELTFKNNVKVVVCDLHKLDGIRAKDLQIGEQGLISKRFVSTNTRSYDLLTNGKDGSYRSNGIGIDSMIPELHKEVQKRVNELYRKAG